VKSDIHSEAVVKHVSRCNWRLGLSKPSDTLRGRNGVSLEMQLETDIE